jgi:hypothetical protein
MSSLLVDIGVRSDLSHVVITRLLQLQVEVQRWMSDALLWKHRIGSACICRSFAITEKGYMGLMPEGTVAVAELVLFVGMQTPVVVRGDGAQSPVRMRAQLTGEVSLSVYMTTYCVHKCNGADWPVGGAICMAL